MIREKVIFIIPGFRQKATGRKYRNIAEKFKEQGYIPILVEIPWRSSTISQNLEYFLNEYRKVEARKKYVLGFSYGAMIAFIASSRVRINGIILCSLSPYFREDLSKISKSATSLENQRYKDFTSLHFDSLAKVVKADQVLLMYGAREAKSLIKRVQDAFLKIDLENKNLISIKDTEHDIGDPKYAAVLGHITQELI